MAGAGEIMKGVLYDASISGSNLEVDRRPYHKYCSCPLHALSDSKCCSHHHKLTHISYPIRRSWSEGSLALYTSPSSSSPDPSPSSSPSLLHHLHHHHHQRNHSNVVFGGQL